VDWGGLPVTDIYPQRLPDLFSGQPVLITGRYTKSAGGTVRLKGTRAGGPFSRDIPVTFSSSTQPFDALAGFWARRRMDDLMSQDWLGLQQGAMKPELKEQITQLGLDYRLMTQFTSFVAVEDKVVTKNGQPQRVEVPVEMPEGVSHEGVFGEQKQYDMYQAGGVVGGVPGGIASGSGGGMGAGVMTRSLSTYAMKTQVSPTPAPPPPPPPVASPVQAPGVAIPKGKSQGDHLTDAPTNAERRALESKLQPAVLAALDCFRKSANGGASCANVHSGKVEIMVWFADNAPADARSQLQALGFGFAKGPVAQNVVAGILSAEKLDELAKLPFVKFVSFQRR
jgi:Ca-activated chloride channel family protein